MKKTLILATVAALSLSGAAFAQEADGVLNYWGAKNLEQSIPAAHGAALSAGTVHSFVVQSQVEEPVVLFGGDN